MKTTFSILVIMVFSAIILTPKPPQNDPPKQVIEQRAEIAVKEIVLNDLIDKIEYAMVVDSVTIAIIKQ
jgi:hypothetical protein